MLLWLYISNDAHLRGVQLFQQHKYAEALAVLQQAIEHEEPRSADYRESAMLIGQTYFMMSQAPKAIPWLEKVPVTNESSYVLGYAYQQAGNEEKAVASFARLFGVDPNSAAAHLLGEMLMKRHLEDASETEVKKALAIDPKLPKAHYILAEIAMFRGKVSESIQELERELSINPSFAMAWS
jgi:tetratricopeptide (TPR) repeat protein